MIVLLGTLAFSVDVGYIVVAQTDLQNAADAGALAGAETMKPYYLQYLQNPQGNAVSQATGTSTGSPMKTAETFAAYNKAAGVFVTVPDSDVTFGTTDASGNFSSTYTGFPNTISVTTRRDSNANGALSLFFGPLFGKSSQALTATARATIYVGNITKFQSIGVNGLMLPVALDYNEWMNFYNTGQSGDGSTYYGSNSKPQLQVYPDPGNAPGQFGLLDIGPPANDVPAFRTWIDNAPASSDIQYLLDNTLLPVSLSAPAQWKGGPGMKSTLQTDFASQIGKPNLIPLFKPVSTNPYQAATGNGSNTYYSIVGFAMVSISQADGHGSNMNISVQPMTVNDPTAVWTWAPAGTSQATYTAGISSISAKLTH
jgi:hypothetical protein